MVNVMRLDRGSLISSILANLAMKPQLNRIALLRSHISMVFILFVSLVAGISINLSILVELFEDEIGLIQAWDCKWTAALIFEQFQRTISKGPNYSISFLKASLHTRNDSDDGLDFIEHHKYDIIYSLSYKLWFTVRYSYHLIYNSKNFSRDPIQLDENELVVRNAAGDAIRVTVDPNRTHSTLEIINLDVLPTYEDLFGQKQYRQNTSQ